LTPNDSACLAIAPRTSIWTCSLIHRM
jgi:hypothetical protein